MKRWAMSLTLGGLALLMMADAPAFAQRRGTISSPTAVADPGRSASWLPGVRSAGRNPRVLSAAGDPGRNESWLPQAPASGRYQSWLPMPQTPPAGSTPAAGNTASSGSGSQTGSAALGAAMRPASIGLRSSPFGAQQVPVIRLR